MEYKVLTQQEKDDVIVNFLKAQEMDHFTHSINLERFKELSKTATGEFKTKIDNEIPIIESRIAEIEKIVSASELKGQIPTKTVIAEAVTRISLETTK